MKIIAENVDVSFDRDMQMLLTFKISPESRSAAMQGFNELQAFDKIDLTADKHKIKRTLNQNAYMWELIGQLSAKIKVPPKEIYREAVRDIGGNYEILPLKDEAIEKFAKIWEKSGDGYISEVIGKSKIEGYTNLRCYYGSSTYDTQQMARLIDIIVEQCEEEGIHTATREEIRRMK